MTARGAVGRRARADRPAAARHGDVEPGDGGPGDSQPDDVGSAGTEPGGIAIRLDQLLSERGMTLTELSERVGITVVNLSVLKNGRARAIRFSTLAGLCAALGCQPGDLLSYEPGSGSG